MTISKATSFKTKLYVSKCCSSSCGFADSPLSAASSNNNKSRPYHPQFTRRSDFNDCRMRGASSQKAALLSFNWTLVSAHSWVSREYPQLLSLLLNKKPKISLFCRIVSVEYGQSLSINFSTGSGSGNPSLWAGKD